MTTLQKQTSLFTAEELTSLRADFPVNHTQWQGSDLERKMSATSGRKCLEQYEKFNHVGLWAKTFSASLIGMRDWYSRRCRLTWKLKGTKYNRTYFQLVPSTLPTEEIGFGLLPTLQTQGLKVCDSNGKTQFMDLSLLPTPVVQGAQRKLNEDGRSLSKAGQSYGVSLQHLAKAGLLPTPTATDWKGAYPPTSINNHPTRANMMRNIYAKVQDPKEYHSRNSQLNPRFVAEMMGFPENWTESPFQSGEMNPSKPMETP